MSDLTSDIASFQATTATNNPILNGNRSINGFEFTAGTAAWSISASGGTRTLTLGSSGITSNADTTQTFTGSSLKIALGANATFTQNGAGALSFDTSMNQFTLGAFTLTLSGSSTNAANSIAEPVVGTGGIIKDGTGTWLLSGVNTYTGKTAINNGVLAITAETGLGGNPGSFAADQLSLNGGTLRTQTAAVTIDDARRGVTLGASGGTFDTVTDLTISNVVTGSGSLTKTSSGVLTLGAANTYTGKTIINGGVVAITAETGLGSNPGAFAADQLTLNGGTLRTQTSAVTIDDANRGVTLGASGGTFDTVTNLTIAGTNVITGSGSLTKSSSGTLTLAGANTYDGATSINAGVVTITNGSALGSTTGGTSVTATNAALQMQGNITVTGESLNLTGTGITNGGALRNVSGDNQWAGAITATGPTRINSDSGTLTLGPTDRSGTITIGNNTITMGGSGDIMIKSALGAPGDTGGFTKDGTGTITFNSLANGYTGTTTVNEGTLVLDTANSNADVTIRGNLVIGDGTGTALVKYGTGNANDKIADTSSVTIKADGTLDLQSHDDTIGAFNMTGGTVNTGTGVLRLNGDVTTNASGNSSTFNGVLSLGDTSRTFTVADGGAANDLLINSTINNGSITKEGAGTMTLTADNSIGYGGTTTINAGVVELQNSLALGQSGASDQAKGTSVTASGAALQLRGGIAVGTEGLWLTGTGVSNGGALRNVSGDNSWAGAITLTGATQINSDLNTLTLNGAVIATNQNLTVGGAGNTTINGAIGTGTGTLSKTDAGTLTLTGNSTYSGATTVSAGVLNIRSDTALGSTNAGTTVSAATGAAALELQGGITVGNESLSLTGTGISSGGALRNVSGDNTWGGTVTLAGATRINSDANTLTLAGITATNQNLTVGGAGNTTINGAITTGTGTFTKDGGGTVTLGGANTYTGTTTVSAGTLRLGPSGSLADTAAVSVSSGATFDVNGRTDTIGSLAGAGNVQLNNGALTVADASTTSFSGTMSGPGTLIRAGTGTLSIDSNIGFGGDINITGGTLQVSVDNIFSGAVTLSAGTLRLTGSADLDIGTLNITGNSTIDFAGTANILSVTNLNISAGVTLTLRNWQDAVDYFYADNWTGAIFNTTNAAPMNRVVFDTNGADPTTYTASQTKWQSYDNQITPVPEPSTYGAMLMGAGLAFFGFRRWRRCRAAA